MSMDKPGLTYRPRWSTLSGGEVGVGDAVRLGGAAFGESLGAPSVAGIGLVFDVGSHGQPVVLMLCGAERGRSAPVWPAHLLQPVPDRWQTRSGEAVGIGDYAALAVRGQGRDPVGRIINVGAGGDPVVWVVGASVDLQLHVDASDLLVRVER